MHIRNAKGPDAAPITHILNVAIKDDAAIGKDTARNVAERLTWITQRQAAGFPVIVAVMNDEASPTDEEKVIGFASFGPWRDGNGYRYTVELSIYVHADHQGEGVGKVLLEDLIAIAKTQGRHVMIAAIETQNEASIEIHRSFNFEEAGHFREVGYKRGERLDLTMMQLLLSEK